MEWEARITTDPDILAGKPVVRGTRIAVELVIDLLASGSPEADILRSYPRLTPEDIRACLAYAGEAVRLYRTVPLHA
jgi:uncharacterized protein (DUF433 family)